MTTAQIIFSAIGLTLVIASRFPVIKWGWKGLFPMFLMIYLGLLFCWAGAGYDFRKGHPPMIRTKSSPY